MTENLAVLPQEKKPNEWFPHDKQEVALLSTAFETLYGGARGGGKTDAGMAWMLYPIEFSFYRGLVIRKNSIDLHDWISRAKLMYSGAGAVFVGNEIRFPSGAIIFLGHLKDKEAFTKYLGHEYHRILIEELTLIPTEESYLKLISSCRSTNPEIPPRVFATTNPGNIGHFWVKKRFVDPAVPGTEFPDPISGRTRMYIPATVEDNPTLMDADPEYVRFLDSLAPDLKAQWRHGIWERQKIKGAWWADEMEQVQVQGRICPVNILPNVPVYTYWDLGINSKTGMQVVWFVQYNGDQIRVFWCHADSDKGYDWWIEYLRDMAKDHKIRYAKMVLPHDGTKRSPDSLKSWKDALEDVADDEKETWADFEVEIVKRTNDKTRDIQKVREILPRCVFDSEHLEEGTNALMAYRREWVEDRGTFRETVYKDWTNHYADGFMALACSLPKRKPKGGDVKKAQENYMNSGGVKLPIKKQSPLPQNQQVDDYELRKQQARSNLKRFDSNPF